ADSMSARVIQNPLQMPDIRLHAFPPGHSYRSTLLLLGGVHIRGYNISEQATPFAGSTGSEMAHLFYNTLDNKGLCDPVLSTAVLCAPQAGNWGFLNGPFNVDTQRGYYWSNTRYEAFSNWGMAWLFTIDGRQAEEGASVPYNAWAVHPGDVGAVPEPQAYGLMLAGLGLIGLRLRASARRPSRL
ncbi:MAG: PEP-CTERM sorting domain-containing protein, partial [Pseudomonadota bacterium]